MSTPTEHHRWHCAVGWAAAGPGTAASRGSGRNVRGGSRRERSMRLIFVDNLIVFEVRGRRLLNLHPHLGLASLASVAQSGGHHCEIFDPKRAMRTEQLSYD